MSQLEVDKVIPQSGTTLTLGESGDTITIASGATFTPTLTAPIIDEINDTNGNEEIIFTTTTSAVNELTIANAATGNAPEIAATGDDTDIDLKLTPKGAGNLVLDGIEFPNADGTVNQVLQTNGSGVLSFGTISSYTNSDALTLFNATGSAPVYACRAWVNFNGTGTPAIRGSGNVSSITDDGTGLYTVNYTTALQDVNYTVVTCNNTNDGGSDHRQQLYVNGSGGDVYSLATTSVQLEFTTVNLNGYSRQDSAMVAIGIFR
jgi:hypothetical protein